MTAFVTLSGSIYLFIVPSPHAAADQSREQPSCAERNHPNRKTRTARLIRVVFFSSLEKERAANACLIRKKQK